MSKPAYKCYRENWIKDGKRLEQASVFAWNILKVNVRHNRFDHRYVRDRGIDLLVETPRGSLQIECKNLSGRHMLSPQWIREEVLARFSPSYLMKVLVVSLLNCSRRVRRLLKEQNVYVIELGDKVTWKNYRRMISVLVKRFYRFKKVFGELLGWKPKTYPTSLDGGEMVYNSVIGCRGFGVVVGCREYCCGSDYQYVGCGWLVYDGG
jgi:hypothetical protein